MHKNSDLTYMARILLDTYTEPYRRRKIEPR